MNLNFVLGTAAELIKVYPVIHAAIEQGQAVRVISTGQSGENFHMQYRDLNLPESAFFSLHARAADLDKASSALRWFVSAIFMSTRRFRKDLLCNGTNDIILVHGDTLSSLVGAVLGWRCGLKVAHIEAGLRSPSLFNPFPEEITRRLVSKFARVHFVPDALAEENLKRAGVRGQIVCTQGNTLMDAVMLSAELAPPPKSPRRFALVNIHRFENLNSAARWEKILATVSKAADQIPLIFVTHPQTRAKLDNDATALARLTRPEIEIRPRMPFTQFVGLLKDSEFLISDGGSNQEECSYLGKPCLLLREATERREGLGGCCVLTKFDDNIIARFLQAPTGYATAPLALMDSPSQKILDTLQKS